MPRNLPAHYETLFQSDSMMLCVCAKITRRDGVVMCFTTTDQYLEDYEGHSVGTLGYPLVYKPVGSVASTSIKVSSDTGVDNMEIFGVFDSDEITDEDIRREIYDSAEVDIFVVDPSVNPILAKITAIHGHVGMITLEDGKWTWEIRSASQQLKQQFGKVTTPTCRCKNFADFECAPGGVLQDSKTKADYTVSGHITLVTDEFTFEATPDTAWASPDTTGDYYAEGELTFTSGMNTGIMREVKSHTDTGVSGHRVFLLRRLFPFPITPGTTVSLDLSSSPASLSTTFATFTFTIPAGVYSSATWDRNYTVSGGSGGNVDTATNIIVASQTTAFGHTSDPDGTYTDTVAVTSSQLAAINAAAGTTVTVFYQGASLLIGQNILINSFVLHLGGGTTGDAFDIVAGCQRRFRDDCIAKFSNPINFHGEPEIPGNDTLIQIGR